MFLHEGSNHIQSQTKPWLPFGESFFKKYLIKMSNKWLHNYSPPFMSVFSRCSFGLSHSTESVWIGLNQAWKLQFYSILLNKTDQALHEDQARTTLCKYILTWLFCQLYTNVSCDGCLVCLLTQSCVCYINMMICTQNLISMCTSKVLFSTYCETNCCNNANWGMEMLVNKYTYSYNYFNL